VLLLGGCLSVPAGATTLTVPDQVATIQAALDARPDTVLVRPGVYAESPQVIYDVALLRTPDSSSDWVVVDSLTTHNESYGPFYFLGLQVKGPVTIIGGGVSEYHFTQCDLQGSVDDHIKNYGMILSRCRVGGSLDLWIDYLTLDSCDVKGSVTTSKDMSPVIVRGCTIEGGGVSCLGDNVVYVENNTIRGGGFGVHSRSDVTISNNLIEDCSGGAITIDQGWATISNNVIMRCGAGISVDGANAVSVAGNTIDQSRAYGLAASGVYEVNVSGNTFRNCVGDGMSVGDLQGGQ